MWNNQKGLKIKKLFIKNYNVLQDFEINFCDENEQPLPIIVLAGVNGTGKTTILECISQSNNKGTLDLLMNGIERNQMITVLDTNVFYNHKGIDYSKVWLDNPKDEKSEIIFIPYNITNFDFIQKAIVEFIDKLIYEQDIRASEVYNQCSTFIKNTLKNIELNIEFSRLDKDKNIIFTKNNNDFLFNFLSSGEQSLFARVLYLYLAEIKDKVILIDEPESSLHPTWQSRILKLYENYAQQNNCQIIIATHSPLILGSAKNKYIRILYFENNKINVLENPFAYGRNIEWILKEIMNLDLLRDETINKYFDKIHQLIKKNKLDEAENEIQNLEQIIGSHDQLILNLRNEIDFARIEFEED